MNAAKNAPSSLRFRIASWHLMLVVWLMFTVGPFLDAATFTVINTNDTGTGSLRQAITDANTSSNVILFQISGSGPFTINLQSTLPTITQPVLIDGTSQTGYQGKPLIQLNGAGVGANGDGIQISGSNCTIKGLAIYRCRRDGIRLSGTGSNIVQGCYLGTDATGTNASGNAGAGIYLYRSSGNQLGGTNSWQRNIICANAQGIYIDDASPPPVGSNNWVLGNYIGTTADGSRSLGNTNCGIYINQAPGNHIGNIAGGGNLISGNLISGVYIYGSASTSNILEGNWIGTDVTGTLQLSNRLDGVTVYGASSNRIGGASSNACNLISGNGARGILILSAGTTNATGNWVLGNYIGTDITGSYALANQSNGVIIAGVGGNWIGGPGGARNLISGNRQNGILISQSGASNNFVQGNFIGCDRTGTNPLPNSYNGVMISGGTGNVVGGTNSGTGNVISGNQQAGIYADASGGGSNWFAGNWIGTDATGTRPLANAYSGIWIENAGNLVGGTPAAAGNTISGNAGHGIYFNGSGASNNLVQGNRIGTDQTGSLAIANGSNGLYSGVYVNGSPGNQVGGTASGAGNIISGNGDKGVTLSGIGCTGNKIQGNLIGTDITGLNALPNTNGGIYLFNTSTNTIGGTNTGAGNLISGNNADGIYVSASTNIVIQGNNIGTTIDGTSPLGNLWHNVEFLNNSCAGWVGGSVSSADNRIAYNRTPLYSGVRVRTGCIGNKILRNSIFSNGDGSTSGLGICVGPTGVNTNGLPVLTTAVGGNGQGGIVRGTCLTTPNATFQLQLYANATPHVSGYGEGKYWIGGTNLTTDATGNGTFLVRLDSGVTAGEYLSATLTDSTNNTGEFAACQVVLPPPTASVLASNTQVVAYIATNSFNGKTNTFYQMAYYLGWSTNYPGFSVYQATNLAAPINWTPITNSPASYSNQYRLPLSGTGAQYFQLKYP